MPTVVQLPAGKALTIRAAADVFLDSLGNPNTVRNCGIGVGKTAERLGEARPLASVADDEIGEALAPQTGEPAPLLQAVAGRHRRITSLLAPGDTRRSGGT